MKSCKNFKSLVLSSYPYKSCVKGGNIKNANPKIKGNTIEKETLCCC